MGALSIRSEKVTPAAETPTRSRILVGVISDTHGLFRSAALETLRGVDYLIHAGDVGKEEILNRLSEMAPLTAVRGNVDRDLWAERLPVTAALDIAGVVIHVLHDVHDLDLNPRAAPIRVVISGHSHQPSIRDDNGVIYLNPGSAGPRRFKLPVSVAHLEINANGGIAARLIELHV